MQRGVSEIQPSDRNNLTTLYTVCGSAGVGLVANRAAGIVINEVAPNSSLGIYWFSSVACWPRAELICLQICKTYAFCSAQTCDRRRTWIHWLTLTPERGVYQCTTLRWSIRSVTGVQSNVFTHMNVAFMNYRLYTVKLIIKPGMLAFLTEKL